MKLVGLLLFIPFFGFSQIEFKHVSLNEAKKLALEAKKPIFVDVYAQWCGPCKYMASTTFQDKEIGKYFNQEFINVKIDGEHEDGPNVMAEYAISAYPTLLFIAPDGKLIETHVGAADVPTLRRLGIKVAHPDQDPVGIAIKAYENGSQSKSDLKNLIQVLHNNQDKQSLDYGKTYLQKYPQLDFNDEFDRLVYFLAEQNPNSELTDGFIANINKFDPKQANDKLVNLIVSTHQFELTNGNFSNTEAVLRKLYPSLQKLGVVQLPELDQILLEFKMQFDAEFGQ